MDKKHKFSRIYSWLGTYTSYNYQESTPTCLVYDSITKVIYYSFDGYYPSSNDMFASSNMCPYISENGKFCKFIDNKITEIQ